MAMTLAEIQAAELSALGLTPANATATRINLAIRRKYPGGLQLVEMDHRTGLPYTTETARAAGSNNVIGRILGALTLAATGSFFGEGIAAAVGGDTAAGSDAAAAASAGADTAGAAAEGSAAAAGGGASAGATAGGAAAGSTAGGLFGKIASSITGPIAFLGFIAWIFHPLNILRAVEFLTGLATMALGVHLALSASVTTRGQRRTAGRRILRKTAVGKVFT